MRKHLKWITTVKFTEVSDNKASLEVSNVILNYHMIPCNIRVVKKEYNRYLLHHLQHIHINKILRA